MNFMLAPRIVTVEEYTQQLDGVVRLQVERLFQEALFGLTDLKRHFWVEKPDLRIRIARDATPDAQASELSQLVLINEGMINHCLNARFVPLDTVFSNGSLIQNFDYELVGQSMLAWVIAHEITHIYRCHNQIAGRHKKSASLVSQVLERDADMFAAAYIYRLLQRRMRLPGTNTYPEGVNDFAVRKFTLYCVFWGLRTLIAHGETGTHLLLGPRILLIIQKLATVSEEQFGPPPISIEITPRQQSRTRDLYRCLRRYERLFNEQLPGNPVNILEQIRGYQMSNYNVKLERKWKHLRHEISELSGSYA